MKIVKKNLSNKTILIIGDLILDEYLFGTVERISPEAPVPILNVLSTSHKAGGAANVAINCKSLGCKVKLVGSVGNDQNGFLLEELLKKYNVNYLLDKNNKFKTIKKTRLVSKSQQIIRIDEEKNAPTLSDVCKQNFVSTIADIDVVVFSDYNKGMLNDLSDLITITKKYNKISLVDPKGSNPYKFKGANILTPNLKEMEALVGKWKSESMLQKKVFDLMEEVNIENIVLTRSSDGITLYELKNLCVSHFKSDESEIYDVTGAGDSVISIISVLVSINFPIRAACNFANKGGGIAVKRFGAASLKFEEVFN